MAYRCVHCSRWNSDCRVKDGVDRRCAGRVASDLRHSESAAFFALVRYLTGAR